MTVKVKRGLSKRFIDYITFINQPIRKKFILFSIGVLFWFVTMFFLSMATLLVIDTRSGRIVNYLIPQDRTAQKIIRKLQRLSFDTEQVMRVSDPRVVLQTIEASRARLEDVKNFGSTLLSGGQINDYSRDSGNLLESYATAALKGDAEGEKYVTALTAVMDAADEKLDELSAVKMGVLGRDIGDDGQLGAKLAEFNQLLSDAIVLSHEFSVRTSKLYMQNSEKIRSDILCTGAAVTGVLLIATALLIVFTIWISASIAKPVKSIIGQIRALGEGDIDFSKKIEITSKDEIGVLSSEFNGFMEAVHSMTVFKKVIEEDEGLEDVYSRLGHAFSRYFGLAEFMIYEISNSRNKMKPVYPVTLSEAEIFCNTDILENCYLCRAKKTGQKVSSLTYPNICKYFLPGLEKEYVCIPMLVGGSTGGVVQFTFDKSDKQDVKLKEIDKWIFKAEQYIRESVPVIESKRLMNTLKESSLKDSLTGLYNRRFLQEYTENLVAGALRRGKNIGLLMCDLDYFKQVNDVYGHNTGDALLKETSNIIRQSVRTSDLVIRFGGEEFLVVLLDIVEDESVSVAEKIRENVENAKMKVSDGIIRKTISIGISEFPADTESFWHAIKFADVALYEAKETGRNRAIRFVPALWKEEQF